MTLVAYQNHWKQLVWRVGLCENALRISEHLKPPTIYAYIGLLVDLSLLGKQ